MKLIRGDNDGFLKDVKLGAQYCTVADEPAEYEVILCRMQECGFKAPVIQLGIEHLASAMKKFPSR